MPSVFSLLQPWLTAARPVGHGMIALPILWGQAVAFAVTGQFSWWWFVVAQMFAVCIQVHSLYLNDYADEALDRQNHSYWLSGGSRVIPDGQLTGVQLYRASFIPALAVVLIAGLAAFYGRPWLPVFALLALLASASYSLPPLKASYRGVGEWHQGLSCGVGLPLWAYYLQTGGLWGFPWWWLLPLVLIFFASNITTALPDRASDAAGGKRSYPVRFGEQTAKRHALIISLLAAILIPFFVMPTSVLVAVLMGLPALLFIAMLLWLKTHKTKRFMVLIIIGHLWLMVSWTAQLFWLKQ